MIIKDIDEDGYFSGPIFASFLKEEEKKRAILANFHEQEKASARNEPPCPFIQQSSGTR